MSNAKTLETLIYFGQNFWVVTVIHKHTVSLTMTHHLFLEFWLVDTWFFLLTDVTTVLQLAWISNCQRNTLQTLSVLKFHLLSIKVHWNYQPTYYINPALSRGNILGHIFITYVSHFLLTLTIRNANYVWISCVLITLAELT